MILGMTTATFTLLHVVLSLIGIASGFVVLAAWIAGKDPDRWTKLFLGTTAATTLTGFAFPISQLTPGLIFGILSTLALTLAALARQVFRLNGPWRRSYVLAAAAALYLNSFVAIVQAFQKVPALNALAPTGTEAPFGVAQALLLGLFVYLVRKAMAQFREVLLVRRAAA